MRVIDMANMAEYTSFKCGGYARKMIIVDSVDELIQIMDEITDRGSDYLFLGNGSNTLFADGVYEGTVLALGVGFEEIKLLSRDDRGGEIVCMAAALLSKTAKFALANELAGLEFASGIPGSIGGAVFMNAGAYGGEMKDVIKSAKVLTKGESGKWQVIDLTAEELELGYRHSRIQETKEIVISATLRLKRESQVEIEANMAELTKKRTQKQPLEYPSAGSFFKRPEGYFAGKLIEDAGLRGLTVGGAQVSDKHCGFVINKGGASAGDIIDLMHLVQNTVFDKFGVKLEPEVRIIGL